jgi:hypothetical protein
MLVEKNDLILPISSSGAICKFELYNGRMSIFRSAGACLRLLFVLPTSRLSEAKNIQADFHPFRFTK